MSVAFRLAAFAALLVVVFVAGLAVGGLFEPFGLAQAEPAAEQPAHGHGGMADR